VKKEEDWVLKGMGNFKGWGTGTEKATRKRLVFPPLTQSPLIKNCCLVEEKVRTSRCVSKERGIVPPQMPALVGWVREGEKEFGKKQPKAISPIRNEDSADDVGGREQRKPKEHRDNPEIYELMGQAKGQRRGFFLKGVRAP